MQKYLEIDHAKNTVKGFRYDVVMIRATRLLLNIALIAVSVSAVKFAFFPM